MRDVQGQGAAPSLLHQVSSVSRTHSSQPLQQRQVDNSLQIHSCTQCTSQGKSVDTCNVHRWELARAWDLSCSESKQAVKQMDGWGPSTVISSLGKTRSALVVTDCFLTISMGNFLGVLQNLIKIVWKKNHFIAHLSCLLGFFFCSVFLK